MLVLPREVSYRDDVYRNFDVVLSPSELKSLPRIGRSAQQRIARQELAAVQTEAKRRYNIFLRMGRRYFERTAPMTRDSTTIRRTVFAELTDRMDGPVRRAPGGFLKYQLDDSVVVASTREAERGMQRRIAALALDTIKQSYSLDGGIPYLIRPAPHVLLIDRWPLAKFDPLKPSRAAAFAGIALAAPRSTQELFRFVDRLTQAADRISS